MGRHDEVEDGMGFAGLVASPAERAEDVRNKIARAREKQLADAVASNERLRVALIRAGEKLALYRKLHPEYVGGMEYSELMKLIDAALAHP